MYQWEGNTSAWQGDEREKALAPHGRGAQNGTEVSRCAARWGRGTIGIAGHIETQGRGGSGGAGPPRQGGLGGRLTQGVVWLDLRGG